MASPSGERHRYVVLGAGPAGLQLGCFLQEAGADHVVLEREDAPGGFFRRFPRHRRLISLNKVHTLDQDPETRLRWDWNSLLSPASQPLFADYSTEWFPHADAMTAYLRDFQRAHVPRVRFGTDVRRISRHGPGFRLDTADGRLFTCDCLIVATGWGRPYIPGIDGIEHALGYESAPLAPEAYRGKRVLVIGKGNSAFETATPLLGHAALVHLASPHPTRLAWHSKHAGDVRGQYGALLDSYWFKTLHSVLECEIDEIRPEGDTYRVAVSYTLAEGERELLEYDTVIRCTGFRMDDSLFAADCRPRLAPHGRFPATGPDWQSVDVGGLYFAGTLAQARDFRHAASPFIDGFRYNLRTLSRLLAERYEGRALRYGVVDGHPDRLADTMLDRANRSSALWTQFEYLVDVFVPDEERRRVRHYEDLPEDYAVARFGDRDHFYTLGLRWGRHDHADIFAIRRSPVPERAHESEFLHPVIRRYRRRDVAAERHLLEDLCAQWRRPDRHVEPLRAFLRECPLRSR
ncbi:pyridine nucleotide-disulfide oxidoreductase [Streptomyces sp. CB03234]|uniref:NAD(P)-binding domain-containing protein n=1 Tax=Streptomyces sp. (strain CB03234) TaxID=1703937 RepID=UPI00093FCAA3|nr:NAD(P)-binding domain-containing protein [Streptomyces sp. CB03234]OKK06800.1 pyridine nucleotide-disulfide oxidoreductase [Streptomyces sp. CB03234]